MRYLDIETWSRRELFNFFIDYANPYFNVCVQLDVTNTLAYAREAGVRVSSAIHYFTLRGVNEVEQLRYRLHEKQVAVHDVIDGGTTVLMPNESFAYAYFPYLTNLHDFAREMEAAVEEVRSGDGILKPTMRDDVIYCTTLPWLSFTSFAHARGRGRGESIPRFVYGKFREESGRTLMPFSVEVHHALVDGIHVGQLVARMEEMISNPARHATGN